MKSFVKEFATAVSLLVAYPAMANEPRDLTPLLATVTLWLAANYDLSVSADAPAIAVMPNAELVAMRYGPDATVPPGDVLALYKDSERTIYLADSWTGGTAAEISILVHEMVHHLQSAADMRFACPAEREVLAYRAQNDWLGLFNESLESSFGIDATMLLVGTVCTH